MQLARSLRPQAGLGGAARWQKPAPRGLSGAALVQRRARLGLLLKEAAQTDQIVAEGEGGAKAAAGSGNGAPAPAGAEPLVVGDLAAVQASLEARLNGNGNGNGASHNGNGAAKLNGNGNGAALATVSIDAAEGVEGFLPPEEAGPLETAAPEALADRERRAAAAAAAQAATAVAAGAAAVAAKESKDLSAAGTPYVQPGGQWSKFKTYSTFQRTWDIWRFGLTFFFKLWAVNQKWSYPKGGMSEAAVSAKRAELAVWLREGLVKLGPTFIKIGQQFSTRVDVLSQEFIKELEKLQDNVPPFESETAIGIIESSLGAPVSQLFEEFEPQPIAAASLGQVHVAKVKGQKVVVKVQRPGLKELFDIDLKNVRVLAQLLQKVDPKSDGAARDWVAIYDECSRILYQEIDYRLEGANADRFRENFKDTEWVKVPKVLWDYSSSSVLTMEYTPGVKINKVKELDRMGVDREQLARRAVESYLQQLLNHGFFHADPHPGNIAVDAEAGGRLIYYDFGMMGTIPSDIRGGLLELFYGVYEKDSDKCLDALVKMGVLVPGGDRTAVKRTADFFLTQFTERLEAQKRERKANKDYGKNFKAQPSKEDKLAKRKQILSSIGEDLLVASADKPFRFPATFTFVVRSFTVLDGIGKGLNPRFDMTEIAAPYARQLLLEGSSLQDAQMAKVKKDLSKGLANQNRAFANLFRGPNMIEDTNRTLQQLERGDLKLRVRALEAERALARVAVTQKAVLSALVASMLVNMGTVFSVSAMATAASLSFGGAALLGLATLANLLKVKSLEKKEAQLTGAA
ncbi:hypothetical protein COHA_010468 [Chlorella ohadii]|uniref:ABC1 atypical kinase-like domain-containing protein n=1 Tax=Chlorella ohadii TaxID=2649997 RepID=A0AAD5DCS4_9CHLO|nr:hypothetical protein COHA_010468 [Chlorella ohadii]